MITLKTDRVLMQKLEAKIGLRVNKNTIDGDNCGFYIEGPRGGYVAKFNMTARELIDLADWIKENVRLF